MPISSLLISIGAFTAAAAAIVITFRIIVHVTRGFTSELKFLAWATGLLTPVWLISAFKPLDFVHQGALSIIFAPFSIIWYVQHLFLLASVTLLVLWAWHYITLRLLPQFYLSIIAIGLGSFVLSTVIFTTVLFSNAESQALRSIEADVKTFALALSELTDRTTFTSAAIGARGELISAAKDNNAEQANNALGDPIKDYNVSAAYVLNAGGELITSIGTENIFGESFAQDPVASQVLTGQLTGSPVLQAGPESPTIVLRGGTPLVEDGNVVGAILVDTPLDTAFVDRVSNVTGLDVTVFAQQNRIATSLRDADGRPLVPATIEDEALADTTLHQGQVFSGSSTFGSVPYFIAAIPLIDTDEVRIGILAAGLPQQELLDSLKSGTQLSFLVAFGLLILALAPFYFLAKFLAKSSQQAS